MVDQTTGSPGPTPDVAADIAAAGGRLEEEGKALSGTMGEARDALAAQARDLNGAGRGPARRRGREHEGGSRSRSDRLLRGAQVRERASSRASASASQETWCSRPADGLGASRARSRAARRARCSTTSARSDVRTRSASSRARCSPASPLAGSPPCCRPVPARPHPPPAEPAGARGAADSADPATPPRAPVQTEGTGL